MIIPIGGTYINEEKTYKEGEAFPQSIKNGDVYIYRDYEYKYNYKASLLNSSRWLKNEEQNGWGVRVLDKTKNEYGNILQTINGKPVTSVRNTFYECENLLLPPELPNTVVDMFGAFSGCINMQHTPQIPDGIKNVSWAFEYCETISEVPKFPNGIKQSNGTFADCTKITKIPSDFNLCGKDIFINCPIKQDG